MYLLKNNSALLFFLAAFPGYFFYHVLKSTVQVPYVGWFSVVLLLCVIYYLSRSVVRLVLQQNQRISILVTAPFILLIFSMIASTMFNQLLNSQNYITVEGTLANVEVIVWMIALFQIGLYLSLPEDGRVGRWLGLLLISFIVCAIYFFDPSAGVMVMPILPGDNSEAANYQGMARSVICTAFVLLPFIKNLGFRLLLMMLTVCTLYFIGSRTEIILFLIIVPVFLVVHFRLRGAYLLLVGVIFVLVGLLFSGVDVFGRLQSYVSGDASLNERSILLRTGMEGIMSRAILGDYLGQVRDFGATGFYMHNALSMWQQHGLLAFILFIYLCVASLVMALMLVANGRIGPYSDALLGLSITCLVGVLTTKAIFWPIPALAWGLAANVVGRRRMSNRSP